MRTDVVAGLLLASTVLLPPLPELLGTQPVPAGAWLFAALTALAALTRVLGPRVL